MFKFSSEPKTNKAFNIRTQLEGYTDSLVIIERYNMPKWAIMNILYSWYTGANWYFT